MAKIIRTYRQKVPAMRFIGRKYLDADRVDGTFAAHWGEWFKQGWFEKLQSTFDPQALYEDGVATVGMMRWKEEEPFEYWIGVFCPEGTPVPEGFLSRGLSACNAWCCLGVRERARNLWSGIRVCRNLEKAGHGDYQR